MSWNGSSSKNSLCSPYYAENVSEPLHSPMLYGDILADWRSLRRLIGSPYPNVFSSISNKFALYKSKRLYGNKQLWQAPLYWRSWYNQWLEQNCTRLRRSKLVLRRLWELRIYKSRVKPTGVKPRQKFCDRESITLWYLSLSSNQPSHIDCMVGIVSGIVRLRRVGSVDKPSSGFHCVMTRACPGCKSILAWCYNHQVYSVLLLFLVSPRNCEVCGKTRILELTVRPRAAQYIWNSWNSSLEYVSLRCGVSPSKAGFSGRRRKRA